MRTARLAAAVLAVVLPVATAFAEVSDKVEETRAGQWNVTWALLAMTAVAAASGWRRALLLWPVTAIWSSIVFWTVWEWSGEIRREGELALLWESGAMAAALLLTPLLLAGLARRWQRTKASSA